VHITSTVVNQLIVAAGQSTTATELRPVADGADLSALQNGLKREGEFVAQRVITGYQTIQSVFGAFEV
jgi:hypothetical protein